MLCLRGASVRRRHAPRRGPRSIDTYAFFDLLSDSSVLYQPSPASPDPQRARVAVLIAARKRSSGEIVAVSFRGHGETRSLGQSTSGRTSSNRQFLLPDGSRIALTTARIVDRNGKVMPYRLEPDETTPG